MRWRSNIDLWSVSQVEQGIVPEEDQPLFATIIQWAKEFLVPNHPDLGRTGPVCPYTKPSLDKGMFFVSTPPSRGALFEIADIVGEYRFIHAEMAAEFDPRSKHLLTFLILFPEFDPTDSAELDLLQAQLKNDFVKDGLMIGQFHPVCDQPGLWNEDFRPLRAPIPLLAIRYMVPFDLPFLVGTPQHLAAYLTRFAPDIPSRVRDQLVTLTQK